MEGGGGFAERVRACRLGQFSLQEEGLPSDFGAGASGM